jgi:hypothetical protein
MMFPFGDMRPSNTLSFPLVNCVGVEPDLTSREYSWRAPVSFEE